MYTITNEGLRVLEEKGLKKILDYSFRNLDDYMLFGFPYDDEIGEYATEHRIPDLMEKINLDEKEYINKMESFIMHSGIICDLLKDKLPKKLDRDLKNAISAYYIYYDKFLKGEGIRGRYLWRDEKFLNIIEGDIHGDMKIIQYNLTPDKQLRLFDDKSLIKKADMSLVDGFYPEWIRTLRDFITFCIQIDKPVPFKDNWEKEFYNGRFQETEPGEVASYLIEHLKYAKEEKEYSFIEVLPFIDNPTKHINPEKSIYHITPVRPDSDYLFYPFIDNDSIVYLTKAEKGVEFLGEILGNPGVRFGYEQIHHAIKGIVSCIQKGASRCHEQDPGLVFKYFPYGRFNFINND